MKSSRKLPIDINELTPADVRAALGEVQPADAGGAAVLSFEEMRARRQFLQTLGEVASDQKEDVDPALPQQIARHADAVSFILVVAECPAKHRAYVDAVIGASGGKADEWFEADDFRIGMRARAEADLVTDPEETQTIFVQPIKKTTIKKWTQRARADFVKWQQATGLTLIETEPGGKEGDKVIPSRYRVPILRLAAEAFEQAQLDVQWETKPARALKNAAGAVLKRERYSLLAPPRRERFRRPKPTPERYRRTALTYARKLYDHFALGGKLNLADAELSRLAKAILSKDFKLEEEGPDDAA